jgi:hypothetical protein
MINKGTDFQSRSQREKIQKSYEHHLTHGIELINVLIQDFMEDMQAQRSETNKLNRTPPSLIRSIADLIRLLNLQILLLEPVPETRDQDIQKNEQYEKYLENDPVGREMLMQLYRRQQHFFNTGKIMEVDNVYLDKIAK